jgi:hypothetical protein
MGGSEKLGRWMDMQWRIWQARLLNLPGSMFKTKKAVSEGCVPCP